MSKSAILHAGPLLAYFPYSVWKMGLWQHAFMSESTLDHKAHFCGTPLVYATPTTHLRVLKCYKLIRGKTRRPAFVNTLFRHQSNSTDAEKNLRLPSCVTPTNKAALQTDGSKPRKSS
jgi:hypothetical protein